MGNILKEKKVMPLLIAHTLGAFNDHLIKHIFVFLTAVHLTAGSVYWQTVAFMLYGLAFMATALFAGPCADKISRDRLIRWVKLAEIGVMAMTMVSVAYESRLLMLVSLTLLGAATSFMRAVKYAIIPTLVKDKNLPTVNASFKAMTFAAGIAANFLS